MTDLAALTAAALATDDDTPRLAYLDALGEAGGHEDYVAACREFYAKCLKKRRYEKYPWTMPDGRSGFTREALPGWREWLASPGDEWIKAGDYGFDPDFWPRNELTAMNWNRLVPTLFRKMNWDDRWRRKGKRIELRLRGPRDQTRIGTGHYKNCHVDLDFARGWLARVEFRSWQDADALLPAILTDQPFVEAGIRGVPAFLNDPVHPRWVVYSAACGPWSLSAEGLTGYYDEPDAIARARRALSDALRKRAGTIQADKPSPHLSDHQTPPNRDNPDREQP